MTFHVSWSLQTPALLKLELQAVVRCLEVLGTKLRSAVLAVIAVKGQVISLAFVFLIQGLTL